MSEEGTGDDSSSSSSSSSTTTTTTTTTSVDGTKAVPAMDHGDWLTQTMAKDVTSSVSDPQMASDGGWSSSYTDYAVDVKGLWGSTDVVVRRRYRDFEWLYKVVSKRYPGMVIPPIPGKQLIGAKDAKFTDMRARALSLWLNRLLQVPYMRIDENVRDFCTSPQPSSSWDLLKQNANEESAQLWPERPHVEQWRSYLEGLELPSSADEKIDAMEREIDALSSVISLMMDSTNAAQKAAAGSVAGASDVVRRIDETQNTSAIAPNPAEEGGEEGQDASEEPEDRKIRQQLASVGTLWGSVHKALDQWSKAGDAQATIIAPIIHALLSDWKAHLEEFGRTIVRFKEIRKARDTASQRISGCKATLEKALDKHGQQEAPVVTAKENLALEEARKDGYGKEADACCKAILLHEAAKFSELRATFATKILAHVSILSAAAARHRAASWEILASQVSDA